MRGRDGCSGGREPRLTPPPPPPGGRLAACLAARAQGPAPTPPAQPRPGASLRGGCSCPSGESRASRTWLRESGGSPGSIPPSLPAGLPGRPLQPAEAAPGQSGARLVRGGYSSRLPALRSLAGEGEGVLPLLPRGPGWRMRPPAHEPSRLAAPRERSAFLALPSPPPPLPSQSSPGGSGEVGEVRGSPRVDFPRESRGGFAESET